MCETTTNTSAFQSVVSAEAVNTILYRGTALSEAAAISLKENSPWASITSAAALFFSHFGTFSWRIAEAGYFVILCFRCVSSRAVASSNDMSHTTTLRRRPVYF
jgi:hypothetical protein